MVRVEPYPVDFLGIDNAAISDPSRWSDHLNREVEIVLIVRGDVRVEVGRHKFDVHGRSAHVVFPGQRHRMTPRSLTRLGSVQFSLPESSAAALRQSLRSPQLAGEHHDTIRFFIDRITGAIWDGADVTEVNRVLESLLHTLSSDSVVSDVSRHGMRRRELVGSALQFLAEHTSQSISVSDIASHCNVSGDYLTALFKEELETSPMRCLRDMRMNRAKELLNDPANTVLDVSDKLGFNDPHYFSRLFKRQVGVPPSEFRRSLAQ